MAKTNSNLHKAKDTKNDEFYTQIQDISNEMKYYENHFQNKTIFCNCDDPTWSHFWKHFHLKFSKYGLKKLIATHYDKEKSSYKIEYMGGDDNNVEIGIKTPLNENGDFRSSECIELLKEADIVVTNPPFSLFREYVAQLMEYNKHFIIIGSGNAITYKEIFPLIKENKMWLGVTRQGTGSMWFRIPNDTPEKKGQKTVNGVRYQTIGNSCWFTNLDVPYRHEEIYLTKTYNAEDYPKYDNYDAINVDKVVEIPKDYFGVMGVPITFLGKYCPEQFEIVTFRKGEDGKDLVFTRGGEREFNHTFVSLFDLDCRDDKKCRRENQWQAYLCENNNQTNIEPIDYFYPLATNLQNGLVNNCTIDNKKTYVRMLIKRKEKL